MSPRRAARPPLDLMRAKTGVERKWGRRGKIIGRLACRATPMKWTIRLELTPDGNPPITYDIGTITRRIDDLCPEEIGLTLEEGQQLPRRVEVQIIGSQAHAYALCRRPCVHCGNPERIKDGRTKCVQTVFGAFRFRGRRYRSCGCRDHPDGYCQASRSRASDANCCRRRQRRR
jgi:hypothetical protein